MSRDITSLSFSHQNFTPNIFTNINKVCFMASWKQTASPPRHCWKRPDTWWVQFTSEENTHLRPDQNTVTPSQQPFLSPRGEAFVQCSDQQSLNVSWSETKDNLQLWSSVPKPLYFHKSRMDLILSCLISEQNNSQISSDQNQPSVVSCLRDHKQMTEKNIIIG